MTENIPWRDRPEFSGTIVTANSNTGFTVLLDDGRMITASVSSHVARQMFRIVPSDRVRIKSLISPKSPRIVDFYRN